MNKLWWIHYTALLVVSSIEADSSVTSLQNAVLSYSRYNNNNIVIIIICKGMSQSNRLIRYDRSLNVESKSLDVLVCM